MTGRAWLGLVLVAVAVGGVGQPGAQEGNRRELARDLAHLMLDDPARRAVDEQVGAGLTQAIAATLQERLNRRLQEVEWQRLVGIVRRFVAETLPPSRSEEIAPRSTRATSTRPSSASCSGSSSRPLAGGRRSSRP